MKVEVSKLSGAALDYTVAKCQGRTLVRYPMGHEPGHGWWIWEETSSGRGGIELSESIYLPIGPRTKPKTRLSVERYTPSTEWAQGGPIIEREISKVFRNVGGTWSAMILKDVPLTPDERGTSLALSRRAQFNGAGLTPLIAAMRCYVAGKLGEVVEVPDELVDVMKIKTTLDN